MFVEKAAGDLWHFYLSFVKKDFDEVFADQTLLLPSPEVF